MSTSFTAEDLKKQSAEKLLLQIDDEVWDVTKFAKLHPGGKAVLEAVRGTDATEAFYGLHKNEVLEKYRKRLVVGKVAGAKPAKEVPLIDTTPFSESSAWRQGWHSPYYSESHDRFRKAARVWLKENVAGAVADEHEESGEYPSNELYEEMGRAGILVSRLGVAAMPMAKKLGIPLPGGVKPEEFDFFHEQIMHEETSRIVCAPGWHDGLGGGYLISVPCLLAFTTPEQKERLKVADYLWGKKKSALAISEPQAGSDVAGMVTTAVKQGDHYVVNGVKKWITGGAFADGFVTGVRTGKKGGGGLSMLYVERQEGVQTTQISTSYSKAAGTALVFYDDCKVPAANLLGKEGQGMKLIMVNFNHERWAIICGALGGMRGVLTDSWKWAVQRKAFGKALIEQPVIRNKIARMVGLVESCQAWLDQITDQMKHMDFVTWNSKLGGPLAALKFHVTRCMTEVSDNAVQVFGGRGITKTGMGRGVERFQKTFKYAAVLGGSEEIMADLAIRQSMMGAEFSKL